jgi:flagellar biosynthesis/type III secretory pathway protein FliH
VWLHLRTVESDHQMIVRVVDAVLADLHEDDPISLRIHPRDHEALITEQAEGNKPWSSWDLELVRDPEIQRGGCVVEVGHARVDATVADRLERLGEELDRVRAEEPQVRSRMGSYR